MNGRRSADFAPEEPTARDLYLKVLGLSGAEHQNARKAALLRAHEIRQFEIELYWKRANYFWLLQAAVFAAVGLTWRADAGLPAYVPVALSSLGLLTAFGGWLATQGSKFWQRNWEHHIDMLEGEFEGDLYKTVYLSGPGVRWSVSGVSETLAMWFTAFWLLMVIATAAHANPSWNLAWSDLAVPDTTELKTLTILGITAVGAINLLARKGRVRGDLTPYSVEFSQGKAYSPLPKTKKGEEPRRRLMRREPNIVSTFVAPAASSKGRRR